MGMAGAFSPSHRMSSLACGALTWMLASQVSRVAEVASPSRQVQFGPNEVPDFENSMCCSLCSQRYTFRCVRTADDARGT